jgi:small GTP-binding protein
MFFPNLPSWFECVIGNFFMAQMSRDHVKIAVIGDCGTGKTSLLRFYCYNESARVEQANTIGSDQLSKSVEIEGREWNLDFWDTAGSEQFRSLIPGYLRDSDLLLVVFSIVDRSSFDSVGTWISYVRENCACTPRICIVGNKCDLASQSVVSSDDITNMLVKNNVSLYYQISALTGYNIDAMFRDALPGIQRNHPTASLVSAKEEARPCC